MSKSGNEDDVALFSEFLQWKKFQEQTKRSAAECGEDSSVGLSVSGNPSTTGVPDTVSAAKCPEKAAPSADEYLSRDKKFSGAKKVFRHILKKSSEDAKCWGNATLKELTPAQRKHIHDKVIEECPGLKGHARDIDLALAKALSEAKYYVSKKAKKGGQKWSEVQKKSKSKDGKGDSKLTKTKSQRGVPTKTGSTDQGGSNTADLSDYERSLLPRKELNKALRNAVKNSTASASSQVFSPGDEVLLKYKKQSIAVGTFIKNVCDMFCEVGFRHHLLNDEDSEEEICLPVPVMENVEAKRKQKLVFSELEEDDVFTWKLERVEKNTPKGGYVVGLQQEKDMFASKTVQGPRSRKPNSLYADYL